MKKLTLMLAAVTAFCLTACGQNTEKKTEEVKNVKTLVVYFSASGVTAQKAETLAKAAKADIYRIVPEQPYTAADLDWTVASSRSSVEMKDASSRPAIAGKLPDVSGYGIIYVGYPIWWDKAPTIVNTFLDACDLEGKTLIPFATSGGSAIDNSAKELKAAYPKAKWLDGRLLNSSSQPQMESWVKANLQAAE